MNSTSFTLIKSTRTDSNDKMANIDSSSTAQLTLNAAMSRQPRSARGSNNSDSDTDRSPSVTVLTSTSNSNNHSHHHHHHLNPRASQLITSGFSLSNRLHLTKHQSLWSRATSFEKLLMLAVLILATTTILLFISLITVLMLPKQQSLEHGQQDDSLARKQQASIDLAQTVTPAPSTPTPVTAEDQNKKYCLTPDCVKVAASVIEAIDQTVDPCDDFYVS